MVRKIRKTAVVGAGVMGGGIAALFASAGVNTLLLDIASPDEGMEGKKNSKQKNKIVQAGFDAVVKSKPPLLMKPDDADLINIGNFDDDFDKLRQCDWIVEAVVESLDIKRELFKRIEKRRKKDSIVSTNTSGLPLRSLSQGLSEEFKQHFLGTHFFNPVRYMRLLEIIPGEEVKPEIRRFVADFGERILGKGIVWAKDAPNFVGNRIGVHQILLAMQMMEGYGLNISHVDALFGPVLGRPKTAIFKTCDLVGIDTLAHVARNTYELIDGDEQREVFKTPAFLDKMLEKRTLGNKSGQGFYKTEIRDGEKVRKILDVDDFEYKMPVAPAFECLDRAMKADTLEEKIRTVLYGEDRGAKFAWDVMAGNLIYASRRIPEIADTIVEIDNAMKWGYNFEMGPFETWDAIGLEKSVVKMEEDGYDVPGKIKKMIGKGNLSFYKFKHGKKWYYDFDSGSYKEVKVDGAVILLSALKSEGGVIEQNKSASLVDLKDGVFCIEFHTKSNVLNKEIIDLLDNAFDHVDKEGVGLVIGNQTGKVPGAFSAGGDLDFMGSLAEDKKFEEIEQFIQLAQKTMQKLKYASFPVAAAPYGFTLGGGCEICLGGADRIVAHSELYMGLVEIGVGLLPAAGGCMNLWKKLIQMVPECVKGVDLVKIFKPVFRNIAMAKVSSSAANARSMGFLGPEDRIVFNRDHLIGEAKKEIIRMVDCGYRPPVKRPLTVFGDAAQGVVNMELKNMLSGGWISKYDAFLAGRIGYVISGGDSRCGGQIDEDVILKLEREAFVDFWKESKTLERVEHMLRTGKPLRN